MRNKSIVTLFLICIFILCGCQKDIVQEQTDKSNYLTVYRIETFSKDYQNPQWNEKIKEQLSGLGLNEVQIENQMAHSTFEKCKIEYGSNRTYNEIIYPYAMTSDIIVWKSEEYYTICEVSNNQIKSLDNNIELVKEEPDEMWNEGDFILKVLPVNQATFYTIGGRASFVKEGKDKAGPFTLVQSFYIPCPL